LRGQFSNCTHILYGKTDEKGTIPMYYTTEVMQHYIGTKGRVTSSSKANSIDVSTDQWKYEICYGK
jgi:hypothetical protein